MIITGVVFRADGKTPASNVIVYIYHTNEAGRYPTKGSETGDAVYNYFTEAWGSVVLPYLKYSLEVKPVDWSDFPKNLPLGLKPAQQFVASGR